MPTAIAISGIRNAAYFQDASTKPDRDEADGGDQEADADHLPAAELLRQPGHQGRDQTSPTVAGQRRQAGLEGAEAEGGGVLEVEAEQVHQPVDGAGADQDRDGGADQDPVAEQRQVEQRDFTRCSTATKANPATIAIAKQTRVAAESQPQSPLLLTPRINGTSVSAISSVPA